MNGKAASFLVVYSKLCFSYILYEEEYIGKSTDNDLCNIIRMYINKSAANDTDSQRELRWQVTTSQSVLSGVKYCFAFQGNHNWSYSAETSNFKSW